MDKVKITIEIYPDDYRILCVLGKLYHNPGTPEEAAQSRLYQSLEIERKLIKGFNEIPAGGNKR